MESDIQDFKKKAFTVSDNDGNEYIKYKDLLEQSLPKKTAMTDLKELNKLITKVQAVWRGYLQRRAFFKQRMPDLKKIQQQLAKTGRGV